MNRDRPAAPRTDVHRRPPIRFAIRQADVIAHLHSAVDERRDLARGTVLDREIQVTLLDLEIAFGVPDQAGWLAIRLHDVVHTDVAPAALRVVNDAEGRDSPRKLRHVPRLGRQRLAAALAVIWPRRAADDVTIHEQLQREPLALPSADEERNELPLNPKLGRCYGASRGVTFEKRSHQPFTVESLYMHLPGHRPARRSTTERFAGRLPRAVVRSFEVGNDEVVRGECVERSGCEDQKGEKCYHGFGE